MSMPVLPAAKSIWGERYQRREAQDARSLADKIGGTLASAIAVCRGRLRTWNARINERAFLRDLHECELHEMGLSFDDRCQEVNKPFWRA